MYTLNYIINYTLSDTLSLFSRLFLYSKLPIDILIATLGADYLAWFTKIFALWVEKFLQR